MTIYSPHPAFSGLPQDHRSSDSLVEKLISSASEGDYGR